MTYTFTQTPRDPLPTGSYVNQVTTGQTQAAGETRTGDTYTAGQLINAQIGTGIWMFPVLRKYYKHLQYLLFDYNKPGQKSLKTKFLPIDSTITSDGKSLTWYDYSMFDVETKITANAASSVTISMADTKGYEVGDTILVSRKPGSTLSNEKRTITAVVDNTSITVNSAVVLENGDKIVRAFYVQAAHQEITRGASSWNYVEFTSFFQRFGRTINFKKEDLNRTYFFEKTAKEYITGLFAFNINILLQEFNKALYLGGNVPGQKSEMLGIDTAIKKEAIADPTLIVNFATDTTDDAKVKRFMAAIEDTAKSGATGPNDVITVVANHKFISAMGRLKKDDIVYNDKVAEIDYNIITFRNLFGTVEMIVDPILDDIEQGAVAYMLPKALISCKFRQNQRVTNESGAMEAAKGEITIREKIHNIPDVSEFDMYFEASLVLGGLSSGAYRKLINLS